MGARGSSSLTKGDPFGSSTIIQQPTSHSSASYFAVGRWMWYISFLLASSSDMKVSLNQPMHSGEIALEVTPKSPWLNGMRLLRWKCISVNTSAAWELSQCQP